MQAALDQNRYRTADREFDSARGCGMTMGNILDRHVAEIDPCGFGRGADLRFRPDQQRVEQALLADLDRSQDCSGRAWVDDGGPNRREAT